VWEAINFAGRLELSNLTAVVDVNRLGQSGPTMYQWEAKAYAERIASFNWEVYMCDGHNVKEMLEAFGKAKRSKKPSFIVAKTVKGKGVSFTENADGRHGKPLTKEEQEKAVAEISPRIRNVDYQPKNFVKAAVPAKGPIKKYLIKTEYKLGDKVATRLAFGKALQKLGRMDRDMVVLDGDVQNSTYTNQFFEEFPERSLQCYIAEQNMVSTAVGLQTHGFDVFFSSFACFLTRAYDQLRMAAYSRANLKVAGSHAGTSIGEDGPSQMGLEDLGMFRSLMNSIVLYPCDAVSSEKLTCLMANYVGISYLRTSRPATPVIYDNNEEFTVGGLKVLRQSSDDKATIVAAGITVHEALKAYEKLKRDNIAVRVVDCYSVKPLDETTLRKASDESGHIITVEDHYAEGGLGEAVASLGLRPRIVAVRKMPHSGPPEMLMAEQGIDADGIVREVKKVLG